MQLHAAVICDALLGLVHGESEMGRRHLRLYRRPLPGIEIAADASTRAHRRGVPRSDRPAQI